MTEEIKSKGVIIVCSRCKQEKRHQAKGMCNGCYNMDLRLQKHYASPMIKCQCSLNCDKMTHSLNRHGLPAKFYPGHQTRGKNNSKWKGGIGHIINGYARILFKDHPFAEKKGRVMFHRIVYEMYHKCCLLPWVDIHHRDGNKKRNHPENLESIFHGKHSSLTNKGRKHKRKRIRRKCVDCGSKTIKGNWYRATSNKRYRCGTCHKRLVRKKKKEIVV